ncbi:MAG: DUF924 family protein [Gammaproteobacteria bacterium]
MFEKVNEILDFWLGNGSTDIETRASRWWGGDPKVDQVIRDQFLPVHQAGQSKKLEAWRESPKSCLAYIILFDQFSRNMFRGTNEAFEFDVLSLSAAEFGIENKFDKELAFFERLFFYMPLQHSEKLAHQKHSVVLYKLLLDEAKESEFAFVNMIKETYTYAIKHFEVIERFGRFPHRNAILRRKSTKAEKLYLEEFPSGF